MLRGAYSHINNFSKFILLISLVFSFLLFSALLGIIILVPFYGSGVINLLASPDYSNASVINAMKVIQILNMVGGLLIPTVINILSTLSESRIEGIFGFLNIIAQFRIN